MQKQSTLQVVRDTLPVVAEHGVTITTTFYNRLFEKHPELKNIFNMTHQRTGHQQVVQDKDAAFYFCGPTSFMKAVNRGLKAWGVSDDRIHYEFFGSCGSLDEH